MLEWIVFSKEKDDIQLITADTEMWRSTEFIDKVLAKEGKDVLLFRTIKSVPILLWSTGAGIISRILKNADKNSVLEIQATYPFLIMASLWPGILSVRIVFLMPAMMQSRLSVKTVQLCQLVFLNLIYVKVLYRKRKRPRKQRRPLNWFRLVFQLLIWRRLLITNKNGFSECFMQCSVIFWWETEQAV